MKGSIKTKQLDSENDINRILNEAPSGILDGLTLFRFAHIWRNASSGGVEAHLQDLNRYLLHRNKMCILQMYFVPESGPFEIEIEPLGRGEIAWIPSLSMVNQEKQTNRVQQIWATLRRLHNTRIRVCHDLLLSALANYQINLAVLHHISEDSRIVINYLNKRQIPFVVVNHFQNSRLMRSYIRKQITKARAIGGISSIDVPNFVMSRFTNLSNGIDTDFFHPKRAIPLERKITEPMILLPARVTIEKGHLDAVKTLVWLTRTGLSTVLVFAGRHQESPIFMERLKRVISEEGVQERVIFAGELSPEELRNWYAASDLVVLPSYSEGLGRVLLEAQAMGKPVVAYNVGGVAEAVRNEINGYLVSKGDIEELSKKIMALLLDQNKRCEMGARGRDFVVKQFSLKSLADRHESFYAKVLNIDVPSIKNCPSMVGESKRTCSELP